MTLSAKQNEKALRNMKFAKELQKRVNIRSQCRQHLHGQLKRNNNSNNFNWVDKLKRQTNSEARNKAIYILLR